MAVVLGLTVIVGTTAYCQARKNVHITLTPGVDFAALKAQDTRATQVNFPDRTQFRVGVLLEVPIASGKWAVLIEPTLQRYITNRPLPLRYRSFEVPLGARRYFAVRKNASLYVNGAFVGDVILEHTMLLAGYSFTSSSVKFNIAAGAGMAINRFTIEYRYYTQRTRTDYTNSFTYNYNKRSVIVGVRLY